MALAKAASSGSARRPVLEAQLASAQAAALKARAALDLARQDRGHTLIVAPIDGVVGNRQVQVGDFVQPGSRVFTVVPVRSTGDVDPSLLAQTTTVGVWTVPWALLALLVLLALTGYAAWRRSHRATPTGDDAEPVTAGARASS